MIEGPIAAPQRTCVSAPSPSTSAIPFSSSMLTTTLAPPPISLATTTPPTREDISLEEGLAMLLHELLVDMTLMLALTASDPAELAYQHNYLLTVEEKWVHVKHLFKRAAVLAYDLVVASVGIRINMRLNDPIGAHLSATRFLELMEHPIFNYFIVPTAVLVPVLEYFEDARDIATLSHLLSLFGKFYGGTLFKGSLKPMYERLCRFCASQPSSPTAQGATTLL